MPATTKKTDGPLVVQVHLDSHGAMYSLEYPSERRVRTAFPNAKGLLQVFLGYEDERDFESCHRPYWELVGQLVTDLTPEQISSLGGMSFQQTHSKRVIWEWLPGKKETAGKKARLVKTG